MAVAAVRRIEVRGGRGPDGRKVQRDPDRRGGAVLGEALQRLGRRPTATVLKGSGKVGAIQRRDRLDPVRQQRLRKAMSSTSSRMRV
jgi:hypothetical protein